MLVQVLHKESIGSKWPLRGPVHQYPCQEQVVGEVPCSHSIEGWPVGKILIDGAIGLGPFSRGCHS